MKKTSLKKVVIIAAALSFLSSYLLHHPKIEGSIYSDIVSFWYRPLVKDLKIPYVQEGFEYPPLAGLIVYVSSLTSGGELIPYYNIFSIIVFSFYMLLVLTVFKVMDEKNTPLSYLFIFLVFAPSTTFYLNYNFDIVFTSFVVLSLMFFEGGEHRLSALLFSLGMLTKLVNIILLPMLLLYLRGWRSRLSYLFYAFLPFAAVNTALEMLNPSFFRDTYFYHAEWGLENAWFVYLFPSRDSWDTAKLFSALLMGYGLLKIYLSNAGSLYERALMLLSVFLLTNYVFTPQMVIFILPLLAIMGHMYLTFYVMEASNVGIILTWFMEGDPLMPGTLPQNLALLRAASLLCILLETHLRASGKKVAVRDYVNALMRTWSSKR